MAIDSKCSLLNQTEKRLSTEVTLDAMRKVLSVLADVLDGFNVEEVTRVEEMIDLSEAFYSAMRIQGRSQKTIDRYRYVIGRMTNKIGLSTRKITVHHIRAYLISEKERGIEDSTLEGVRQVLSSYFNWLQREALIERNPMANVGVIKCAKKNKQILTDIDMDKLNRNCRCIRDRAIVNFLAATGCRVSEMVELNRDQLDFEKLKGVVHGKGDKERTIYFDPVTAAIIKSYLESRKDDNPALFVGRGAIRLLPGGVRRMLNELASRAGVEHVHPHKFRRTLATVMSRHGMPLQEVAQILGHEKLDTTMQYVVMNEDDTNYSYRRYA